MVQFNRKSSLIRSLMLVMLCVMLFSFSAKKGGDSFTIHLNNKLLLQQFVLREEGVKTLTLNESAANETLSIAYSHCGKVGSDRSISARDLQNKVLKEWHFMDVKEGVASPMSVKVKDILSLQKSAFSNKVNLIYMSKELPQGRTLATLASGDTKASLK
jgi:hypothetical protein